MTKKDISENFESGAWRFTPDVAAVFDQHVTSNVPNYNLIQKVVTYLSDWLAPDYSTIVDVGASTGTTTRAISLRHPHRNLNFFLYDSEMPMLELAKNKNSSHPGNHRFAFCRENLLDGHLNHKQADLNICLFVLQFLPLSKRAGVLKKLHELTTSNTGTIVVAEKVWQPSAFLQEIANEATWDYKSENGISAEVIRTKAKALRGVLQPVEATALESLLEETGWTSPTPIYRWHSWGVWVAKHDGK
jgi:trans-aconitate methyltransferase